MAISIDWATRVITIPQSFLTPLGGSNYELKTDDFRLALKDLEDDANEGMPFPDTHRHNTNVVLGGITYTRFIEIINDYTVTFENGTYAVVLTGSNNNILDVTNLNSVSVRSSNSAGLQVVTQGSGVTEQDKLDISSQVWSDHVPTFQAKVWPQTTAGADDYLMAWFKNGEPVLTGVTNAKIRVVKAADGTDLVPEDYATEVGGLGAFRYSTALKMQPDSQYIIVLKATIDSADRVWYQPFGHN